MTKHTCGGGNFDPLWETVATVIEDEGLDVCPACLADTLVEAINKRFTVTLKKAKKCDGPVETPIKELDLSHRTRKVLEELRIPTLRQIATLSVEQILKHRKAGSTTLTEIQRFLSKHGLKLQGDKS